MTSKQSSDSFMTTKWKLLLADQQRCKHRWEGNPELIMNGQGLAVLLTCEGGTWIHKNSKASLGALSDHQRLTPSASNA